MKVDTGETLGLAAAVFGHVALFALLAFGFFDQQEKAKPQNPPIAVTLIDETSLLPPAETEGEDAAPGPEPAAAAPAAPPEPEPAPVITPASQKLAPPAPKPVVKPEPVRKLPPKPIAPLVKPIVKPVTKPKAVTKPATKPVVKPVAKAPTKPVSKPTAKPAAKPGIGQSKFGSDLGKAVSGLGTKPTPATGTKPAAAGSGGAGTKPASAGTGLAQQKTKAQWEAKFIQDVLAKIKPHWRAPTGVDSEQLKTRVNIRLNRDGSIASVDVIDTIGVTESNRNQKDIHAERAMNAVRRARSFTLPDELYDVWQTLGPITFDKRL